MKKSKPSKSSAPRQADWGKLLLWTPLLVGGVVAAVFATRAVRLRRAVRKMIARPPQAGDSPEDLRRAILGNDKETIAAVFGPPRTAMHRGAGARAAGAGAARQFLAADAWYYPLDRAAGSAVVIEFEGGVAARADFIRSPVREEKS